MSTIKLEGDGTMRAQRIMGVIAASIVGVVALAGCSSSSDSDVAADQALALEDAGGEIAAEAAEGDSSGGADLETGSDGVTDDRSLIVTGSLYITVEDPIEAADEAAGIVDTAGGRIDARYETAADDDDGGSASMTLRIPGDSLDRVVDELRALGTVDEFSTESRDVTTEVTDLDTKISTLRASTDRIQAFLLEAEGIKDIITLEDELAGRQAELESLEAQQRGLDDQVSMSTIDLSLTTEPVVIVEEESPQTFSDGLSSGWDALVAFVSGALVIVGVLLPWLAVAAVAGAVVLVVIRSRRSRSTARSGATEATGATGATGATQADATPSSAAAEGPSATTPET